MIGAGWGVGHDRGRVHGPVPIIRESHSLEW